MASRTTFSLLLLATSAVLLLSANQAVAVRGRLANICAKTGYPALCSPVVKKMINPIKATKATIMVLLAKTKEAEATAAQFKKGNQAIGVCHSTFADAIYNLEKALQSVKAGDKDRLNVNLSAVVSDYGACVDAFIESRQVNTLQNSADVLRKMGSNCLALSTLIL